MTSHSNACPNQAWVKTVQFNGALAQALRGRGWRDGVEVAVTNSGLPATSGANTNLRLGRFTTASAFWNGDICELVLYNAAVSDANINLIHAYLKNRWGFA